MTFLTETGWLGLEPLDFKEDGIKSDLAIDAVTFILALFFDNWYFFLKNISTIY